MLDKCRASQNRASGIKRDEVGQAVRGLLTYCCRASTVSGFGRRWKFPTQHGGRNGQRWRSCPNDAASEKAAAQHRSRSGPTGRTAGGYNLGRPGTGIGFARALPAKARQDGVLAINRPQGEQRRDRCGGRSAPQCVGVSAGLATKVPRPGSVAIAKMGLPWPLPQPLPWLSRP